MDVNKNAFVFRRAGLPIPTKPGVVWSDSSSQGLLCEAGHLDRYQWSRLYVSGESPQLSAAPASSALGAISRCHAAYAVLFIRSGTPHSGETGQERLQ